MLLNRELGTYPSHGSAYFLGALAPRGARCSCRIAGNSPSDPEKPAIPEAHPLVFCYPQDAPVGPSGPWKLPFSQPGSQLPWETLAAPLRLQPPSGVWMGREPGGGGLQLQKQGPETPRYLSGFANFGSFKCGYGRFRISFLEEKRAPFVACMFVFLQISILSLLGRPLNESLVRPQDLLF